MKIGSKARITCPPEFAYGHESYFDKFPADTTIYYELELIGAIPLDTTKKEKRNGLYDPTPVGDPSDYICISIYIPVILISAFIFSLFRLFFHIFCEKK